MEYVWSTLVGQGRSWLGAGMSVVRRHILQLIACAWITMKPPISKSSISASILLLWCSLKRSFSRRDCALIQPGDFILTSSRLSPHHPIRLILHSHARYRDLVRTPHHPHRVVSNTASSSAPGSGCGSYSSRRGPSS